MALCLIVDDSSVIRKITGTMLKAMNIDTCDAEDGQQALEVLTGRCPDLMLLDWNMPVMDGLECLKKLRSMALPIQPKVIICTTENSTAHIIEAMEAGADEYIMKPFDSDILHSKLEQVGAL